MPPQLKDLLAGTSNTAMQQIGLLPFVFLMAVSLVGTFLASWLYLRFYSSRATGSQVHRAFPLLGLSITAIFVCIQFSLPLSLGLLGALSIVRFRTPIKEPEEIGFIMLVIAASVVALLLQTRGRIFGSPRLDGTIVVTVPEAPGAAPQDASALIDLLRRQVPGGEVESLARQETSLVLSYVFQGMSQDRLGPLEADLRTTAPGSTYSVFFARPGAQ